MTIQAPENMTAMKEREGSDTHVKLERIVAIELKLRKVTVIRNCDTLSIKFEVCYAS